MKYVIGLGNPEDKYLWTRHNIGFAVVENVALSYYRKDPLILPDWKKDSHLQSWIYQFGEVTFIRPLTYVNETGRVIAGLLKSVNLADVLLVCDDVNLIFGKLRLRVSGSAGGHHGLESVIREINSEDFLRLRIGVGQQNMPTDLTNYVLGRFNSDEMKQMDNLLKKATSVCQEWVEKDFESAMKKLSILQGTTP